MDRIHTQAARQRAGPFASRWAGQDSNLRRLSQRIYSPPPLPLGTPTHVRSVAKALSGADGGTRTRTGPLTRRVLCRLSHVGAGSIIPTYTPAVKVGPEYTPSSDFCQPTEMKKTAQPRIERAPHPPRPNLSRKERRSPDPPALAPQNQLTEPILG